MWLDGNSWPIRMIHSWTQIHTNTWSCYSGFTCRMLILREYIEVWSSSFQSTMCLCDHHLHQLTRLPEADCDIRCTRCDSDTCGGIKGVSVYSCKWSTASNLSRSHWHSESYIRGNDMHNNSIHIKLITWVLRRSQRNKSYFLQIIVSKDKSTSGNTFCIDYEKVIHM